MVQQLWTIINTSCRFLISVHVLAYSTNVSTFMASVYITIYKIMIHEFAVHIVTCLFVRRPILLSQPVCARCASLYCCQEHVKQLQDECSLCWPTIHHCLMCCMFIIDACIGLAMRWSVGRCMIQGQIYEFALWSSAARVTIFQFLPHGSSITPGLSTCMNMCCIRGIYVKIYDRFTNT